VNGGRRPIEQRKSEDSSANGDSSVQSSSSSTASERVAVRLTEDDDSVTFVLVFDRVGSRGDLTGSGGRLFVVLFRNLAPLAF